MYKAMFVDDEYMILQGLKMILPWEELGFEVVYTAKNASEALDYLTDHTVDLLITDIQMPEMNGIEMIQQAQITGNHFFSIILSGYQEFNYVKQGMALGVRNYLVKPVNKQELRKSVIAIAEELAQQEHLALEKELYQESSLLLWLNDELNESEYQHLLAVQQVSVAPPYTVLQFMGDSKQLAAIHQLYQKQKQPFRLPGKIEEGQLTVIAVGERQKVIDQLNQVIEDIQGSWQVIVSETAAAWEDVYHAYEKIKQVQSLQNFYPDLFMAEPIIPVSILERNEEQPLLSFNKALTIGDRKTVQAELDDIFDTLTQAQADPEHVRYTAFLLFNDMYRQLPALSDENHEVILHKIKEAQSLADLRELFDDILRLVKSQPSQKRYSEIVQKTIQLIEEGFTHDLTVKAAAEDLHVSVVYLGQLFKKETEMSFNQYVNRMRIKHAQKLLLQTTQTVSEVGDSIGYNNTNYFSKMFKKLTGLTPKEFRDRYSQQYESLD
ncbi:response regulator transcription factor [Candidatus Enterococcus testudinis]|uniref:response regulator transcription factor n=1 Tax=Candidatus Enterococcus testudinis TaxID=1834191 RepID=UPI000A346C01|nr:response regulator transcription factor [Enterococcus sp. 8G7_MSG3316]